MPASVWETNDESMRSLARQPADACGAPMAVVSLMEKDEQRFLACVGRGLGPTLREETFCAHCIFQSEPMVVQNTLDDARFRRDAHVTGGMKVRFYIGAPIVDGGLPLDTVCVVDTRPHEVSSRSLLIVERLAQRAASVLRLRRFVADQYGPFAPPAKLRASLDELNALLIPLVER